jgi:uncharacterized protein YndB with AHSA1/START domain
MKMATSTAEQAIQTLSILKEVEIAAPIEIAFEALLAEFGPEGQMMDGKPFPKVLEPWPGGRWYRDLGNQSGHLWGHVQVIKPPTLLELSGPMFMSFAAVNHVQCRLTADGDITRLKLTHQSMGAIPEDFRMRMGEGWDHIMKRIGEIAQRPRAGRRDGAK